MKAHPFNAEALERLIYWIKERDAVRHRKEGRQRPPWTKDPIIANYRFCNVRRNDDKVTRWIHQHWLHPHSGASDLWFAMVVARLVNWPDTLDHIAPAVFDHVAKGRAKRAGEAVKWNRDLFVHGMHQRKEAGEKVFSGAYIVSTNGHAMDKAEYLADYVLTPLWEHKEAISLCPPSLAELHERLMQFDGLGSFMAAQVVADIKYDPKSHFHFCKDFSTWAAMGPGSKRGMLRLLFGDLYDGAKLTEHGWFNYFQVLWPIVTAKLPVDMLGTAQDLQNCLCEFDKFERVRLGQGKPRSGYVAVQN